MYTQVPGGARARGERAVKVRVVCVELRRMRRNGNELWRVCAADADTDAGDDGGAVGGDEGGA
eukprot:6490018-Prymnesium_polylepis.1